MNTVKKTYRPKPAPSGAGRPRRPQPGRVEKEAPNRINEQINVPQVRVVGDGIEGGSAVMPTSQALRLAREQELDLIEISPKAEPPVVRIADYQKFLYQQKRKAKELKAKAVKVTIKEIRFGPQTDDHDYNFKLRHAQNFIGEGSKVKAYVFFKGRSIVFKEQGEILLLRFATDLEEIAKVEMMPKLEGKRMTMMLAPKPKK
ncbi:MAG TPA: translation initiation factor IF-3 [Candidatus Tidjanibacter gallistercoris]|nr:translation initiation factor IF-3 [Candidatus Tidjanibacter gallistercoris]